MAALTSNKPGFLPRLISGKPLKSLNQHYNKQRAKHQSRLSHENRFTSYKLDRITTKRNRRIDAYLHTVILQVESYTSKASFLDCDPLPTYQANRRDQPVFSGMRIARSWYRASDGTIIHADINGRFDLL